MTGNKEMMDWLKHRTGIQEMPEESKLKIEERNAEQEEEYEKWCDANEWWV